MTTFLNHKISCKMRMPHHEVNFKSPLLVYMLHLVYACLLLQVDNQNLATNFKNYCFYAMLIKRNYTPLYKKTGL